MIRSINPNVRTLTSVKSDLISADGMITRKRALWYISKYICNFIPAMRHVILQEMIDLKLLKEVDRFRLRIVNYNKSNPKNVDSGLLIKILESGETDVSKP